MIRILSNKCIYRFKYMYFSYLYIRTISGSVDYIRVIFVVILAKANMHIFKYKYTFCLPHAKLSPDLRPSSQKSLFAIKSPLFCDFF